MEEEITSSVGANVFEAENCTEEISPLAVYELELENEPDVREEVWRLLASGVWEDVFTCVGTTRGTCDDVPGVAIPLVLSKVVAVDLSAIFADDLSAIFADVLGVAILVALCGFVAVDIPAILADVVGIIGCRGAEKEITWQFTAASIVPWVCQYCL